MRVYTRPPTHVGVNARDEIETGTTMILTNILVGVAGTRERLGRNWHCKIRTEA